MLRATSELADPSLKGWMNGDFNYEGVVDAADVYLFQAGQSHQAIPGAGEPGAAESGRIAAT